MKLLIKTSIIFIYLVVCVDVSKAQSSPLTGTVERVWEDGLSLNMGDRTVNVDAWDVCGDNTQQNVSVGNELTVEGEFSGREFDASAITNAKGEKVCS